MSQRILGNHFVIASNGVADGPAEALRDHLLARQASSVTHIAHPLVAEGQTTHTTSTYLSSGQVRERSVDLKLRPPLSFALDSFVPLRVSSSAAWFGFNCVATASGLARRRLGNTKRVVHWSVDFVPHRFGASPLTKLYDALDAQCCRRSDVRVDLSRAALEARTSHHGLGREAAPGLVVPMGAWLDRTPSASVENYRQRRVVFLGHLVERMGITDLISLILEMNCDGANIHLDIVGGGPLLEEVKSLTKGQGDAFTVHGFVEDHRDVEEILAGASVALAPYRDDGKSFTQWADPGKLKAYLGAGLPIIMTSVPPIASDLAGAGAALVVGDSGAEFGAALSSLLDDERRWSRMHKASTKFVQAFDWPVLLDKALVEMGFDIGAGLLSSPGLNS